MIISIYLKSTELVKRLRDYAKREKRSISFVISELIEKYIEVKK
jgi:predicted DNA-binding protein